MPTIKLIADSGSTKTEWCLLHGNKKTIINSQGMSPYFLDELQMAGYRNTGGASRYQKESQLKKYFITEQDVPIPAM